jgi:hypothetical protein
VHLHLPEQPNRSCDLDSLASSLCLRCLSLSWPGLHGRTAAEEVKVRSRLSRWLRFQRRMRSLQLRVAATVADLRSVASAAMARVTESACVWRKCERAHSGCASSNDQRIYMLPQKVLYPEGFGWRALLATNHVGRVEERHDKRGHLSFFSESSL